MITGKQRAYLRKMAHQLEPIFQIGKEGVTNAFIDGLNKALTKRVYGFLLSSNTQKLYEVAKQECTNTICIENAEELNTAKIKEFNKIGIMAGASTPKESIDNVIEKI